MIEDRTYRIGSIGCGSVQLHHMEAHSRLVILGDRLVAFYDVDSRKAEMAKRMYANMLKDFIDGKVSSPVWIWGYKSSEEEIAEGYKENLAELEVYTDVDELLENVDIADVTTPHRYHVDYAVKALEHNVNVMTEKPMGRTWWEAKRIAEAAKKSKAKYQLSDDNAYIPRFQMTKKAMDSGYIGDISFIEFYRGSSSLNHENSSSFFWDPLEAGGGAMMDYGCHAITLAMFLAGFKARVLSVKSLGINRVFKNRPLRGLMQEIHVDDDVNVKILFEDPKSRNWVTSRFQAGWIPSLIGSGRDYDCYLRIIGSEGEITGSGDQEGKQFIKVEKYGYGPRKLDVPVPLKGVIEEMLNAIASFLRALKDGKEPFTNVDYGLKNMAIMGAAYLSELRGRVPVTLEEFGEFCEDIAGKCKKEQEIPVAIIRELMKPYQPE